ncbi:Nif11-like leader peptide family natural product precursor [Phenylobacterium sp.]|jgi:diketogulonate reductase-like aldo/keto reductase|uniref:Nif11-like leader peptide family natural product precursor n=1 Tax=Phenylobacterium sp. TaxID=1871053 RepID=UPI002F3E6B10
MSMSECERFVADLQSNEALRAEAEKHAAERHHETPIARAVSFAASKGYAFTADEAKERIKAKAKAAGKTLTDAELDGLAGAGCHARDGGSPSSCHPGTYAGRNDRGSCHGR